MNLLKRFNYHEYMNQKFPLKSNNEKLPLRKTLLGATTKDDDFKGWSQICPRGGCDQDQI